MNHAERKMLTQIKEGLTRVYDPDGYRIKVRCVAVWETVGSLGSLFIWAYM